MNTPNTMMNETDTPATNQKPTVSSPFSVSPFSANTSTNNQQIHQNAYYREYKDYTYPV